MGVIADLMQRDRALNVSDEDLDLILSGRGHLIESDKVDEPGKMFKPADVPRTPKPDKDLPKTGVAKGLDGSDDKTNPGNPLPADKVAKRRDAVIARLKKAGATTAGILAYCYQKTTDAIGIGEVKRLEFIADAIDRGQTTARLAFPVPPGLREDRYLALDPEARAMQQWLDEQRGITDSIPLSERHEAPDLDISDEDLDRIMCGSTYVFRYSSGDAWIEAGDDSPRALAEALTEGELDRLLGAA